jgi:hypothetical protein
MEKIPTFKDMYPSTYKNIYRKHLQQEPVRMYGTVFYTGAYALSAKLYWPELRSRTRIRKDSKFLAEAVSIIWNLILDPAPAPSHRWRILKNIPIKELL